MTRIDFYTNADSKSRVVYRICQKVIQGRTSLDIFCPDTEFAHRLDKLLWTSSATGFIPHSLFKTNQKRTTPISIISEIAPSSDVEMLINLSPFPPTEFSRYARLLEIVSQDDDTDKASAREKYRFYKSRGYQLNHHDLASSDSRSHD